METITIDAEGAVYGRVCSFAAKKSLEGSQVNVVNAEKVFITGNQHDILSKFQGLRAKGGHSRKGPQISRLPEKLLRRGIKGMLPDFRWGEGKQAFSRVKCYKGIPQEFSKQKLIKLPVCASNKKISLQELSNRL